MLQVDENIGGRQDQKNNSLRTKTLMVGLLMVVGCFAVGYFSAGTSTYGVGCKDPSTYNPTFTPQCVNVGTGGYTCQNTRLGGATPDFQCVAANILRGASMGDITSNFQIYQGDDFDGHSLKARDDDAGTGYTKIDDFGGTGGPTPKVPCTKDGRCPRVLNLFHAHPSDFATSYCCSKTFTLDNLCAAESQKTAIRCGTGKPTVESPSESLIMTIIKVNWDN